MSVLSVWRLESICCFDIKHLEIFDLSPAGHFCLEILRREGEASPDEGIEGDERPVRLVATPRSVDIGPSLSNLYRST